MNSSVFSRRLSAIYDDDVLIESGRAFQARAAATGNALLYGFDAMTMSDANAYVLLMDRCLDGAVYRIFGVCDKDNVSSLRTVLGSVSNLVKNRRA